MVHKYDLVCRLVNCNDVVLEIYLDHKFQRPHTGGFELRISCIRSDYLID